MNDETYRTQDFVVASYFVCSGFEPEIQTVSRDRVEFVFAAAPKLRDTLQLYRSGAARVPPSAFHLCMVELRRRMREVLQR